ncbi:MAG: protein-L-isoaspartate(D-aspartate) O-methyltransferase [Thermomonospora sp. CIF 1]|nr:MAG: protein-L-isoaspartate(D-aspartate) O-methyltransferase [Thermomonospora sp. CIF 1]
MPWPTEWRRPRCGGRRCTGRHGNRFVPDLVLVHPLDAPPHLVDRASVPEGWLKAVYSPAALVTQLDDGVTDLAMGSGDYTSSCSAPDVVFSFLELLDPYDHYRVLEIGTGTGWTAALLTARLGDGRVVSIEVDEQIAAQAETNLKAAGPHPRLIVGDGANGWPDGAPYDRVHVTCAVRDVPYPWVEQTRPGGIIVLPWSPGIGHGHQVRLHVQRDGTALGRLIGSADYMMLRSQRRTWSWEGDVEEATTRMDPREVVRDSIGADPALAALPPGVRLLEQPSPDNGTYTLWLAHEDGSWATARFIPDADEHIVRQHGPRRLWEEAEEAYFRWQSWGRPGRDRYGITVTPEGQHLWLDDPSRVLA